MAIHHTYVILISILFVLVFALMIHSLARQRKAVSASPSPFGGPTGHVQWLWALVPLAILGYVNAALIDAPDARHTATGRKIELAAAQTAGPLRLAGKSIVITPPPVTQ